MGDGISTCVQKELYQLQQNPEKLRSDLEMMTTQLRSDLQAGLDADSTRTFTKHSKLECPQFNDDDFLEWHSRIEQFFEVGNTPKNQKIRLVMMHLEGRALQFHLYYMRTQAVRAEHPTDLYEAVNLAKHLEVVYFPPFSSPSSIPHYKMPTHSAPLYTTHSRPPNKLPGVLPTPQVSPLITYPNSKQNCPTKNDSPTFKAQGCGIKAQLYQILLEDNIETSPENEVFADCVDIGDESGNNSIDVDNHPIITLHALLGTAGPQTMKVIGKVKYQNVLILIDTGSTHNFFDANMAKRIACTLLPIKGLLVTVTNGEDFICKELCKALKWEVQSLSQVTDVLILSLLGCDMVLGI
ncbi:Retroviral aspartyl protease [Corchorus olitorius]|uniref:Retroviral aspartyl protease n=1 Tax=Corchorus olitorius TaxID=93759 RepID=A0A1R3IXG8_9ROSI|nr:Retroviral aspartyl protease [Corchorus olitorius]